MKNDKVHRTLKELRYIPFFCFSIMLAHVGTLIAGYDWHLAEVIVVVCGFYLIRKFSIIFDFCLVHRLMIYYTYSIFMLIWARRYFQEELGDLFTNNLMTYRAIAFAAGSIIFLLVVVRRLKQRNADHKQLNANDRQ